jgi:pimeloyl-ACP methyl ester carboxylesterase
MGSPSFTERPARKTRPPCSCCMAYPLRRGCSSPCSPGFPIAITSSRRIIRGGGHSDWPDPKQFAYTFDRCAEIMTKFTEALGLSRYALYTQDYGGPVGFRMTLARPDRVEALIVQNAVAHNEGLAVLWEPRRAFWADRAANENTLRENLLSLRAARTRHVGTDPNVERYDPDLWTDEFAFLSQPVQADIQSDLFYDYRKRRGLSQMAGLDARSSAAPLANLGQVRPVIQHLRAGSLSPGFAGRASSRSRRRSFRIGHRRRRNCRIDPKVRRGFALTAPVPS